MALVCDALVLAMALVLAASGLAKWVDRRRFERIVRSWRLVQPPWSSALAVGLPIVELLVAFALVGGVVARDYETVTRAVLVALFGILLVGQGIIILRSRTAQCGCFGAGTPIGPASALRGALFFAVSVVTLLPVLA